MESQFRKCDGQEIKKQIGMMNIFAISGGRVGIRSTGITLPVGSGYSVEIDLAGNDTYTVKRVFKRGAKIWVKGEVSGIHCEEIGEIAYKASCFVNVEFGEKVKA